MTVAALGRDSFDIFGTTAVLLVTRPAAIRQARDVADALLAEVDSAASRFRPDSELSRLNAAAGEQVAISVIFADLLEAALRAARLTGGAVDPTCAQALAGLGYDRDFAEVRAGGDAPPRPTGLVGPVPGWQRVRLDRRALQVRVEGGAQLDLGASAKAWAADEAAGRIARAANCGVLVSLGGDVSVAGPPPDEGWHVRVTDDHAASADRPGQTVTISTGGLATSSTTVRAWRSGGQWVHHIIDPATGEPAQSCWRTVSVAAGSCADANTASTAAIIRSAAAPDWLHDLGLPARLVRHDGTVETTAGWPRDDGPEDAA